MEIWMEMRVNLANGELFSLANGAVTQASGTQANTIFGN